MILVCLTSTLDYFQPTLLQIKICSCTSTSRKGIWADGNKRIGPFISIYLWHEREVVGQFQDLTASSLEYKARLFPDAVWTI
jgi:hypothetical protein